MRVIGERITTFYADGSSTAQTVELSERNQRKLLKAHIKRMKAILAMHEQTK